VALAPTPPANTLTHAVVVGAGMGGLLTAQALSRHVDRVTVVERDTLPAAPAPRAGTPQGRHVHALQPGGLAAIESLLPGFGDELVARGAVPVAVPRDLLWLSSAGWMQPQRGSGHVVLSASRDLIEWVTRDLVLTRSPIAVRTGVEVANLAVRDGRIVGLDVRPRGAAPGEPTERLVADLVVDASGRRSRAPEWLEAAGYERPREEVIDADLSYATRIYRRGPDDAGGWRAMLLQSKPPGCRRMAVMFPIEDDRWMVTVAGANGDVPPTDDEGFVAFAAGLRTPVLVDAIERLEPITPIVGFRRTANRRRRYEELRRVPTGFLVVADAACAFNPVYGQGMSVAALTAAEVNRALRAHLAHPDADIASATAGLQRAVARINAGAWMVATGADLRYPDTVGRKVSAADRLVGRYLDRVARVAASDPVTNAAYVDVITMTEAPTSLMRPQLAARVLTRRSPRPSPVPPRPLHRRVPAPAAALAG
jgi:2-polyprenyl-6-methoxyphenol hydroxylase-like FAD-dependent oxidoreductase